MSGLSRRGFLGRLGAAALLPIQGPAQQGQAPLAGSGEVGTLRDPAAAGRPRAPTEIADYDERIKAIERPPVVEDAKHWAAMTAAGQSARPTPSLPQIEEVLRIMNDGLKPAFDAGSTSARTAVQELTPKVDALLTQGR